MRYIASLGARLEIIVQMPYSIDIGAFRGVAIRPLDSAYRLLHSGQLIERKGVMPFLHAMARHAAAHPDRRLEIWFVGDGPLRAAIETVTLPPNLHIQLLGHLPYNKLPDLYAQCGIQAFPTLSDEWGIVVNEAMAAGLPVLGSIHSQAVEELVRDDVTGWLFDPSVPLSLDHAIERAMRTPPTLLDLMRARAIATVADFTPARMADRMVEACNLALR
jgi:glycosyltransferase involved in cell wall biosynthesis